MLCSPLGNELKWRHSEDVHRKHTVFLHSARYCTSCVDTTGCSPSWLWELKPKLQHSNKRHDHGKKERSAPPAPAPPPGQNQLCLCHSHPFPTVFSKISCDADSVSSSSNLLHCFPTHSIKRFFLLSESPMLRLMLQLRCSQPHVQQGYSTCLCRPGSQPGQPSMLLTSFAKGQHQAQLVIQFAPFSAVMFDYFCPALVPTELSFFPDFFSFLFAKVFWYFNCDWLAAPLSLVASANLAGIVFLGGIARFEILYIAKLWNWKWTWHPNCPALPEPKGHWLNFFF